MNLVSEALEEQIKATDNLIDWYTGEGESAFGHIVIPAERHQWKTDIHALHLAKPFYWNKQTVEFVNALKTGFDLEKITCTRHLLYTDYAFHWFGDNPPFWIQQFDVRKDRHMMPVKAITWYWFYVGDLPYLGATAWTQKDINSKLNMPTGPISPSLWVCTHNKLQMNTQIEGDELHFVGRIDDRTPYEVTQLKLWIVAASTFLRQKLVTDTPTIAERHARKRLEKRGKKLRDIHVVQLRRAITKPHEDTDIDSEHKKVDWQWQWFVDGHSRQQWYPSLQEHLPIYISSFMKGPKDKPVKPRTTPIFSVTR